MTHLSADRQTESIFPEGHLFVAGLGGAFLFHLFLGAFFVLQMPSEREPHRPQLIFLGSILERQDMLDAVLAASAPIAGLEVKDFVYSGRRGIRGPAVDLNVEKPSRPFAAPASGEKITLKATFPVSLNRKSLHPTDEQDAGPPPSPIPYKPLRLHLHDDEN